MLEQGGIGRNPYWLQMLVKGGVYTRNRGELFEQFARELITRELLGGLVKDFTGFVVTVIDGGSDAGRILLGAGLLRSVDKPGEKLERHITLRLLESVRDGVTDDHRKAAVELAKMTGDELVNLFGGLLNDDAPFAKIAGVSLLSAIVSKRSCEHLVRALKDPTIAIAASEGLVKIGSVAIEPLKTAVYDGHPEVSRLAFSTLRTVDSQAACDMLEKLHSNLGHKEIVTTIIRSDPDGTRAEITDFYPSDRSIRAATVLGNIGDERSIEALIVAMKENLSNSKFTAAAAKALTMIGAHAVELLLRHLGRREWFKQSQDRGYNAEGRPRSLGRLKDDVFLSEVARVFAEIGDASAIDAVNEACKDLSYYDSSATTNSIRPDISMKIHEAFVDSANMLKTKNMSKEESHNIS